ncbi:unnamed protein product [Calypogeia fissa]
MKLDSHSTECIFLGYAEGSKAYKLLKKEDGTIMISRDVKFIEDEFSMDQQRQEDLEIPLRSFENDLSEDTSGVHQVPQVFDTREETLPSGVSDGGFNQEEEFIVPDQSMDVEESEVSLELPSPAQGELQENSPMEIDKPLRRGTRIRKPNPGYQAMINEI